MPRRCEGSKVFFVLKGFATKARRHEGFFCSEGFCHEGAKARSLFFGRREGFFYLPRRRKGTKVFFERREGFFICHEGAKARRFFLKNVKVFIIPFRHKK